MLSYHVEREHGRLNSALSPEPTPSYSGTNLHLHDLSTSKYCFSRD